MRRTSFCCGARSAALVAALTLSVVFETGFATAAPPAPAFAKALVKAMQVQGRHTRRLMGIQGVVGTATGVDRKGQPAVKIFTARRGVAGLPETLDGLPVVVEVTGELIAMPRRPTFPPSPPSRKPRGGRGGGSGGGGGGTTSSPNITIVTPADGATVEGTVLVYASGTSGSGILGVEFFADSTSLGVDHTFPYSVSWDTTSSDDGPYTITAVATDYSAREVTDVIHVTVDNVAGPLSPDGRPSPIGISTGNALEDSAGTIACRVVSQDPADPQNRTVYALSNNHVYARENQATLGEQIVQPGLYDTGGVLKYSDQVIGTLYNFVPIDFAASATNTIDAAIAITTESDLGTSTPSDGYGTPNSEIIDASLGLLVQKYGRTTHLTHGTVTAINATVTVVYDSGSATFVNQITVTSAQRFIDSGDSGSLLVTDDSSKNPVGLLFAGSADGTTATASPIDAVLNAFLVTVDGASP